MCERNYWCLVWSGKRNMPIQKPGIPKGSKQAEHFKRKVCMLYLPILDGRHLVYSTPPNVLTAPSTLHLVEQVSSKLHLSTLSPLSTAQCTLPFVCNLLWDLIACPILTRGFQASGQFQKVLVEHNQIIPLCLQYFRKLPDMMDQPGGTTSNRAGQTITCRNSMWNRGVRTCVQVDHNQIIPQTDIIGYNQDL